MTHPSVRIRAALLVFALCTAGLISGTVATTQSDAAFDYNGYIEKAAEAATASKKQDGGPRVAGKVFGRTSTRRCVREFCGVMFGDLSRVEKHLPGQCSQVCRGQSAGGRGRRTESLN